MLSHPVARTLSVTGMTDMVLAIAGSFSRESAAASIATSALKSLWHQIKGIPFE
jgi:hypothetical protein